MRLCGCLSIGDQESHQEKPKTPVSIGHENKRYTLKKQTSTVSINREIKLEHRRSSVCGNESENEQRKFLKLNREKRRSLHELDLEKRRTNTTFRSTPDVNQSTTTCDELDNNPDSSRHKRSTQSRRRRRSKSPRKQMPSEILEAIKFELVEPVGLDENQLRDIPYENIKTSTQPFRISMSPKSIRRRRSSNNTLPFKTQTAIVSVAQVKSTKIVSTIRTIENYH